MFSYVCKKIYKMEIHKSLQGTYKKEISIGKSNKSIFHLVNVGTSVILAHCSFI